MEGEKCSVNMITMAAITVITGLTCKRGERVNSALSVLTRSPRLYAFLDKRTFNSRLNCNNSYLVVLTV